MQASTTAAGPASAVAGKHGGDFKSRASSGSEGKDFAGLLTAVMAAYPGSGETGNAGDAEQQLAGETSCGVWALLAGLLAPAGSTVNQPVAQDLVAQLANMGINSLAQLQELLPGRDKAGFPDLPLPDGQAQNIDHLPEKLLANVSWPLVMDASSRTGLEEISPGKQFPEAGQDSSAGLKAQVAFSGTGSRVQAVNILSPAQQLSRVTPEAVPAALQGNNGEEANGRQDTSAGDQGFAGQSLGLDSGSETRTISHDARIKPSFSSILSQIVEKSKLILTRKRSQAEIQLKPEYLGKLQIRITLENGLVTARFLVENRQVGQLIQAHLHELKQGLQEQGVKFHQINVDVGGGSLFSQQQTGGFAWNRQRGVLTGVETRQERYVEEKPGNVNQWIYASIVDMLA